MLNGPEFVIPEPLLDRVIATSAQAGARSAGGGQIVIHQRNDIDAPGGDADAIEDAIERSNARLLDAFHMHGR